MHSAGWQHVFVSSACACFCCCYIFRFILVVAFFFQTFAHLAGVFCFFLLSSRCCVFSIFRLAPTWQVGPPVQAGACAELCEHLHSKNFSCHYVYVLQGNMSASMYLRKIQTTNELLISKRGVGEEGRAVYSRSVDLVNSMIYGLKKSVGLR